MSRVVPDVRILVTGRQDQLSPTESLVFKTLRTGFPTANVAVYSNASPASDQIKRLAHDVGARYIYLARETTHADWLEAMIGINDGPIAIVDPDILFWESVEDWGERFEGAHLAGRFIPEYVDDMNRHLITQPRLHPSFWWIPDAGRLWAAIETTRSKYRWSGGDLWKPFEQYMDLYTLKFWDTGAQLYTMSDVLFRGFTDKELGSYDHLFCGSTPEIGKRLMGHHGFRDGDYVSKLRGLWKVQERHFERRAIL